MEGVKGAIRSQRHKHCHARIHEKDLVRNMAEESGRGERIACQDNGEIGALLLVIPPEGCIRNQRHASRARQPPGTPRTRQWYQTMSSAYAIVALMICWLATPAAGVFINFQNCLPVSTQNNLPRALQFVPLFLNASFDTKDTNHNLQMTVWGNVTGAYTTQTLPPPDSPDWTSPNVTLGKIEEAIVFRTSLSKKVNVLTYQAWREVDGFCDELTNGSCPLAPTFTGNSYAPPSLSLFL